MYPAVEAVTALAAVLLWNTIGLSRSSSWQHDTHLIIQCAALLLTIPIAVIDKQHTIIPDAITIPMLVIALGASLLPGDTTPLQSLLGILSGGGTLYAIGWLGRIVFRKDEAMGGGDIKLLALFGALWGPSDALLSIFFGSLLGTLGAAALVILKKLNKDHMIPFGPFLALGIWTAVLAGEQIISAYMRFMTGLFFR
jgi:leader peptidase (prepilin peptidase)/N-methyltransferase